MIDWLILFAGAALLTGPTNWAIRRLLVHVGATDPSADPGVGRWIGILERLLIYLLVVAGQPAAAALVAAAKSILRFPEISGDEPTIRAEYVLVGSLASWLAAVGIALLAASLR